tara:strand:+ start:4617 stop:5585 length:969 start_codon:yes stop_codon:yes gene_type:complete
MCILIFAETWNGKLKKSSFEAVSYGKHLADKLGLTTKTIIFSDSTENFDLLGLYGSNEIIKYDSINLESIEANKLASIICANAKNKQAKHIIISNTSRGKSICSKIAFDFEASLITNIVSLPKNHNPIVVKCKAFSSKAFSFYESKHEKSILTLLPNSIGCEPNETQFTLIEGDVNIETPSTELKILREEKNSNEISLTDAERVVSAGRGLKGPENWKMIEELAGLINGGTACSKPVSDMGWRPHSEHVGQTGIAINPDLYIAIGISGAIQHLAGVSNSKKIVVINTDPDAPFFKSADYGVVGDAFEVVPKMIEEIKKIQDS